MLEQRDSPALVVSEDAFDSALDVLCDFEPGTGFGLSELLVAIFLAAGAELPISVSIGDAPCLLRKLAEFDGEQVHVAN